MDVMDPDHKDKEECLYKSLQWFKIQQEGNKRIPEQWLQIMVRRK
jgi:hypothetical protein